MCIENGSQRQKIYEKKMRKENELLDYDIKNTQNIQQDR